MMTSGVTTSSIPQMMYSDTPLLAADSDNDAEDEDFPTAALNDPGWPKEPISVRQICIHMAPANLATGYFCQLLTPTTGDHL